MFSWLSTPVKRPLRALRPLLMGARFRRVIEAFLLVSVLLSLPAPALQAATVVPCGFAEIRGVITGKDGGAPLPNVAVYASHEAGFTNTDTDATGNYTLTVPYYLDKGPYTVNVYPDFASSLPTIAYLTPPPTVTEVISGETTIFNAQLDRGGSIQGQIKTADTNQPMEGVLVTTYRSSGKDFVINRGASTDAQGNYTIYGLDAAKYALRYDPLNIYSTPDILKYETGFVGGVNYVSQSKLTSVQRAVTTTVNFNIPVGAQIEGSVHRSDTNGIVSSAVIQAYLLDESGSGRGDLINVSNGSAFGNFYIGSLAPGKYLLFAQPERTAGGGGAQYYTSWDLQVEWYKDALDSHQAQIVEIPKITPTEPISVAITLSPGAMITGTVTDAESGAPVPNIGVQINNYTPTAEINIFYEYALSVNTDANGVYEIAGLRPGTYQLSYTPPYQGDYDVAGRGFLGDQVSVSGTEVHPDADFAIHRGGNIAGTLTDNKAKPVAGIKVTLYNQASQFALATAISDKSGKYTFDKVAPGQYFVKFDRFDPCGCYNNQYYTGEGENKPALVTVKVGKTTSGINSTAACNAAPSPTSSLFLPKLEH